VLGRAAVFDDCEEFSNINSNTHRKFFYRFVEKYSLIKYPEFVKGPRTEEEFRKCESLYKLGGFDGCLGSLDCVHIAWDNCPYFKRHACTGKEGYSFTFFELFMYMKQIYFNAYSYATVSFQLACDHTRKILHTTMAFNGSLNDKVNYIYILNLLN
jgi:hypothetical protein